MPRKVTPMKYRGFYCSDELYAQMQDIAISLNESDSEYIRKAVEERNAKHKQNNKEHDCSDCRHKDKAENETPCMECSNCNLWLPTKQKNQTTDNRKPSGIGLDTKETAYVSSEKPQQAKPTIPEPKEKMCNPLMKGGK